MKKYSIFLAIIVLAACSKEDDGQTITDTQKSEIIEFLAEETTVAAGEEIHVDVLFSDNSALNQAKFEIHDNFDGHNHGRMAAPFYWDLILDLEGQKTYTDHLHIEVPSDAGSGTYHFTCVITDKSGNESDFSEIDLTITNAGQPSINLINPDPSVTHTFSPTDVITLEGLVKDDVDLVEIHIRIFAEGHEDEVIYENEIELTGSTDKEFDLSSVNTSKPITLPAVLEDPVYELEIKAVDSEQNNSTVHVELEIQ